MNIPAVFYATYMSTMYLFLVIPSNCSHFYDDLVRCSSVSAYIPEVVPRCSKRFDRVITWCSSVVAQVHLLSVCVFHVVFLRFMFVLRCKSQNLYVFLVKRTCRNVVVLLCTSTSQYTVVMTECGIERLDEIKLAVLLAAVHDLESHLPA